MAYALSLLILLGAGLSVAFEARELPLGKAVAKLAASALFLVLALHEGLPASPAAWLVLGGLGASALGDALLLGRSRAPFLAGLVAFLLGHLLYAAAFLQGPLHGAVGAGATVALGLVGAGVLRWLWPHLPAGMRAPVVAYVLAISAMVVLAAAGVAAGQPAALLPAATLFFLSDLAVARDRFVHRGVSNRMWGLPTYYLGQVLFALAVAFWL